MSSVRAVSDTEYSEGDNNSGRGLSTREEGLTTSVGDLGSAEPGSGSAYFYRDPDLRIFTGIQIRDPGSAIRAKHSADLQHWFHHEKFVWNYRSVFFFRKGRYTFYRIRYIFFKGRFARLKGRKDFQPHGQNRQEVLGQKTLLYSNHVSY